MVRGGVVVVVGGQELVLFLVLTVVFQVQPDSVHKRIITGVSEAETFL